MKRLIFIAILTLIALLIVNIQGHTQENDPSIMARIGDFSWGLNTKTAFFQLQPGEARVAHNLDFTRQSGALMKRRGYEPLVSFPGSDSILWNGMFTINWANGDKEMIAVVDSQGVGYSNLYSSGRNSLLFGGTVDSFFARVSGNDTTTLLTITIGGDAECSFSKSLIGVNSSLIDTLVAQVNASACSSYVTASKIGDTICIAEDQPLVYNISVTYGPSYHGSFERWDSSWTVSTFTGDRRATYIPSTNPPRFAKFQDKVYIATGVGKALVYDGRHAYTFPLRAPGELAALPLNATGPLVGSYRYAVRYASPQDSTADTLKGNQFGYLSTFVVCDSQQVFLYDFPPVPRDKFHDTDSVTVQIWRSTGDIGGIDKLDTMWFTGMTLKMDSLGSYSTETIVDSISDDSLRSSSTFRLIMDGEWYKWSPDTLLDSTGTDKYYQEYTKPGAPALVEVDTAVSDSGIWAGGAATWSTVAGWGWFVTFMDTTQNSPSDSGAAFYILQENGPDDYDSSCANCGAGNEVATGFARVQNEKFTFVMPKTTDTNVVCLLYRGPIIPISYDTLTGRKWYYGGTDWHTGEQIKWSRIREYYAGRDFEMPVAYLIGQYPPGDTVSDSLRYDSLLARVPYTRNAVPPILTEVKSIDNMLFGTDGKDIYINDVSDTLLTFRLFRNVPINPDGGDEITTLWPQKGVVRVAMNKSMYNLYRINDTLYAPTELSKHYGCVSGLSHANAAEGDYFLSLDGVRLEDEGIYKERQFTGSLMSGQLSNLELPGVTLKNTFGFYHDSKYILSVPSLDTAYVLNKIRLRDGQLKYAWSTWSIVPTAAAHYRGSVNNQIIPGDTMYFSESGSSTIYRFGSSDDNGTFIPWRWDSGPLNIPDGNLYQLNEVDLLAESDDTTTLSTMFVYFVDDKGQTSVDDYLYIGALDTSMVHSYGFSASRESLFWRLRLWGSFAPSGSTISPPFDPSIQGILLNMTPSGKNRQQ